MNLIDRTPVPGQLGVGTGTNVSLHLQAAGVVQQNTVTIQINGVSAVLLGAFQVHFGGTITADGSNGWLVVINPSENFQPGSTVTVRVQATDTVGGAFDQSYTFQTVRAVEIAGSVRYYEEGDLVEADLYVHENETLVPRLLDSCVLTLRRRDVVVQTFTIENQSRNRDADGYFCVRLMHPPIVSPDVTWEFRATIDDEQAPGVGQPVVSGTIEWVAKGSQVLSPQPDARVGATVPRARPGEQAVEALQVETSAQYEVVDLAKSHDAALQPTTLVDLNFLDAAQYVQVLTGDPLYTGGGSRLLGGIDSADVLFRQDSGELPPTFGARTVLEPQASNLMAGSLASNPFTLTLPDPTIRADVETLDLTTDGSVKQLHYTVEGRIIYNAQERILVWAVPKVGITAGQPVLCSLLARTQLRDETVTLDTFALRVRFYDSLNAEVYSVDHNFDIFATVSETQMSTLEALVQAGSIPVSATQCSFELRIGSWEGCDLMNLWVAAPSIQHALFGTSPIVGDVPATRQPDGLSIDGNGNINCAYGHASITYSPLFDGYPPQSTTLWDTRTGVLDGYVLRHRADGKFEFSSYGPAGLSQQVVSSAMTLQIGTSLTVECAWTPSSLTLKHDQSVLGQFSGSYLQPTGPHATIKIGNNQSGTEPALIELHGLQIFSG